MRSEISQRHRCFIGLPPGTAQIARITRLARQFSAVAIRGQPALWRWIPPSNYHLTLLFLGTVSTARREDWRQFVEKCCLEFLSPAERIHPLGVGVLEPHSGTPCLVLEYECTPALAALRRALSEFHSLLAGRTEGGRSGDQGSNRDFIPHLTLARNSGPSAAGTRHSASAADRWTLDGTERIELALRMDVLVLWESIAVPGGVRYEVVGGTADGGS